MLPNQNTECNSLDEVLAKIAKQIDASPAEREKAVQIIKTLYWDNQGRIRPNSVNSMSYIPCTDSSELKIANYLCNVLGNRDSLRLIADKAAEKSSIQANVLDRIVLMALGSDSDQGKDLEPYYIVHTSAAAYFEQDLKFVLENASRTKEYLVDLLEFYYFFYTAQASLTLVQFEHGKRDEVIPLYFSLDWEKTNKARNCYTQGWQLLQPALDQQFYHAITLELLNQAENNTQFDYIAIKNYIDNNDAENEVAEQVQQICLLYRTAILSISSSQPQACAELNGLSKDMELGVAYAEIHYLFDSVRCQFRNTDRGRVSDGYIKHFKRFCQEKYLKSRGANGFMLNITEELLIFLTKLAIKNEEQMSLNEVFRQFQRRGVYLDQSSKDEVIRFYTKLNLIDKKSDSGDAQYVKRIL